MDHKSERPWEQCASSTACQEIDMSARQFLVLGASVLTLCLLCVCGRAPAEKMQGQVVRLAELEIDPAEFHCALAASSESAERGR